MKRTGKGPGKRHGQTALRAGLVLVLVGVFVLPPAVGGASVEQHEWEGYVPCGIVLSKQTLVPCAHPAVGVPVFDEPKLREHHDVDEGLTALTVRVAWDALPVVGAQELSLRVEDATNDRVLAEATAASPIELRLQHEPGSWDLDDDWVLALVVRPAGAPDVVVDQAFTVQSTLHY